MKTQISTRNFFLHLGAIAAFYASIIALLILLFRIIDVAYPALRTAVYPGASQISFQVATLIVAFPLFLWLSYILQKSYKAEPELKDSTLRRWIAYITLFIAGAVLSGDLITVIYTYLDGRDLTQGFLLKVFVLLVLAGGVFAYYLREIKNLISSTERNVWRIVAVSVVLISIVLGFAVVGSPSSQRAIRLDQDRLSDLQTIQWQVVNYYQQKGSMPAELSLLNDSISGFVVPTDPETGEAYTYTLVSQSVKAFELCAIFNQESPHMGEMSYDMPYSPYMDKMGNMETWDHPAGKHCFERAIDQDLYPVRVR